MEITFEPTSWAALRDQFQQRIAGLEKHVAELEALVKYYEEQFRLNKHRLFGAKSEKSIYDHEQLNIFNEAEALADPSVPEPELVEIEKHYRKARKELTSKLPEELPVEIVEHSLPESEQICPECGGGLHVMGKETRRELKIVPAQAVIVEHVQNVYACRFCENHADHTPILKAPMPNPVIKGSFASPEAVAHLMCQKFVMGAPLYRQEKEWFRNGVLLSRQTMSNWMIGPTFTWLTPIYNELYKRLVAHDVLHSDDTHLQVLHESGKSPQSKSFMWLYRTGSDAKSAIVLYDYQPNRKAENPKAFLADFKGYLHVDGYEGYHSLPEGIIVVGCLAHCRRRYDEALKAMPKESREGSAAQTGKRYCDKLFALERQFADKPPDERYRLRQEFSKPLLEAFFAWAETLGALPQSKLGQAVGYTISQRKYLERYLLDGRLEISNNRSERSIKMFVIDRKNFLFAHTSGGAKASAIMFSIIQTAQENNLNPFAYLTYIFKTAPNIDMQDPAQLEKLMPDSASLPDNVRCPVPKKSKSENVAYVWDNDNANQTSGG